MTVDEYHNALDELAVLCYDLSRFDDWLALLHQPVPDPTSQTFFSREFRITMFQATVDVYFPIDEG